MEAVVPIKLSLLNAADVSLEDSKSCHVIGLSFNVFPSIQYSKASIG